MADALLDRRAGWPVLLGAVPNLHALRPLAASFGRSRREIALPAMAMSGARLAVPSALRWLASSLVRGLGAVGLPDSTRKRLATS